MKVVLLPSNIDGTGCYRNLLPGRELRLQLGWDAHMAPHQVQVSGRNRHILFQDGTRGIDEWLRDTEFDVLLWNQRGERWAAGLCQTLQAQGKRVLVDSDDSWFNLPLWNPGSRRNPDDVAHMADQLRACDGLSVATPALAELYAPYQSNIRVIRNYLDWRMWEDVVPAYELERRRVRIGWMGDSRWRVGDLEVLRPWIGDWLGRHPECEFVAAGDPRVHDLLDIPLGQRVTTAPVEFYNFDLADITATFDIGLVPLKVDDPRSRQLNECKSHLKGLEYAACGIPCIATPTESYRYWLYQGINGLVASTPDEWIACLDCMVENWREMGRYARGMAKMNTLQRSINLGEWKDWIAGAGTSAEPRMARDRGGTSPRTAEAVQSR